MSGIRIMQVRSILLHILFLGILCFPACTKAQNKVVYPDPFGKGRHTVVVPWGTGFQGGVKTTIFTPNQIKGNVLVLPGWKFSRLRWLNETDLEQVAQKFHFRLICPDMQSSIYASRFYPESKLKWGPIAGQQWVLNGLIPWMQAQGIFIIDQENFIMGLSTGGRGVALLVLARPKLFSAAAALSGDFDQSRMPKDRLMTMVYGSYNQFPQRWKGIDNPQARISEWSVPLYLAHGTRDRIVPYSQSQSFYKALKEKHPGLAIEMHSPAMGHDFQFWGSQNESILEFFSNQKK